MAVKLAQHKSKRITISHTLWLRHIFQNKNQIFRFTQPRQPHVCVSLRHNSSFKIVTEEIQLLVNQCLMFTKILWHTSTECPSNHKTPFQFFFLSFNFTNLGLLIWSSWLPYQYSLSVLQHYGSVTTLGNTKVQLHYSNFTIEIYAILTLPIEMSEDVLHIILM